VPLRGIRVLDFTRHLPGPYATDLLTKLGAEVIKIEPPVGDPTRWLPPIEGEWGALFKLVNGGKKSVVVDLKADEGRQFVHKLTTVVDVAVESYRPGVAGEFGIDAERLMAINPRLVYCSISGYGETNPRSGHDINFVALAGLLDLQRDRDGRPVLPATQIGDLGGALFAALAILAALFERTRTGKGRRIDISMSDATRALMPTAEALYRGSNQTPESFFLTGALAAYSVYQTSDGKYIAIGPLEPHFWRAFCEAIGHPELIEKQYDQKAKGLITATLESAIATRSRAEWETIFSGVDACVEPVLTIEESHQRFGDPMARHPLQTTFQHPPEPPQPLGEALAEVAKMIGIEGKELSALKKSGHFSQKDRLQQYITTSVLRFAQRGIFKRRES
jgi:crotonobetainyl-CoA:carnitine CoA-transferase CaiB-like acyl-CoA transferase